MRAATRATRTTELVPLVLAHMDGRVLYCGGSWWRWTKESWTPVDAFSLMTRVRDAAIEVSSSLDGDSQQIAAELGNVRSFQGFLRLIRPDLTRSGLPYTV